MHIAKWFVFQKWGFSYLFNNKISSCKTCVKKKLSKVIPHFKNAVIDKDACSICGDWWTDLSNKNGWFQKHKDYPTFNDKKEGNGNEVNVNMPRAPDERSASEEDLSLQNILEIS